MQQQIQNTLEKFHPTKVDATIGLGASSLGTAGATYQLAQDVMSFLTLGINFAIAMAGLYLVVLRIGRFKDKRKENSCK